MYIQVFKKFNLIEIALALGILGLGITSIISMFPIGYQEIKDAIGENYSAMAAESMVAYISYEAYADWDFLDLIPREEDKATPTVTDPASWGTSEDDADEFIFKLTGEGLYGIRITSNDNNIIDFAGQVILWRTTNNNTAAINLEISWPPQKPYSERMRRNYYFELLRNEN